MAVTKNDHLARRGKTSQKPATILGWLPFQETRLGPLVQRRLWPGQLVQHVDFYPSKSPRNGGREPQRSRIDIAPDCVERRNGTELVEHQLRSHVAAVQNLIHALQKWRKLWIKESVGVGDDANSHASKVSGSRYQEPV